MPKNALSFLIFVLTNFHNGGVKLKFINKIVFSNRIIATFVLLL